jgi:hypothetical protein
MTPQQLDKLEKIAKLKEAGALTQEQFEIERKKIVGLTEEEKAELRLKEKEKLEKQAETNKKAFKGLGTFLKYVLSICILLSIFSHLQNPVYIIGSLIGGLILLPPFNKFLISKNINLKWYIRLLIFLGGCMIAGSYETPSEKAEKAKLEKESKEVKKEKPETKEEAEQRVKENKEKVLREERSTILFNTSQIIKVQDNFSWHLDGFGTVGKIDRITIMNNSSFPIKDFTIQMTTFGNSGSRVGQASQTLYETVPAHGKKQFRNINMGFVPTQSASASFEITNAKIVEI